MSGLKVGIAIVTPVGIVFRGRRYTCRTAIAENWFMLSRKKTWALPVLFTSNCTNEIILIVDGMLEKAFKVELNKNVTEDEKRLYYRTFLIYKEKYQSLKRQRRRSKQVSLFKNRQRLK
ncbi:hypothetical protein [Paenibacillus tyrfis]|uniref:hypothetical protein n=1 Tax=Paenibacillus tyrfis TaxID=1501230 RepID=UPI0020A18CE3|nr:hypothetical protein [Paenibacillus tyrfis]MCP1312250.1 hypothetical protein [Paenibacillus tyrfis]